MTSRVIWLRSWRRSVAMWWRRKAVVKSAVVLMVVQVFVAACVLSLLQQQQEEENHQEAQQKWQTQRETPERVGQYVIMFNVPTTASIEAPIDRSKTQPDIEVQESRPPMSPKTRVQTQSNKEESRGEKQVLGDDGKVLEHRKVGAWKELEGQTIVKERKEKKQESRAENQRKEVFEHPEPKRTIRHGGQTLGKAGKEEEEEEDPNIGRGFVDEYVTYRSDGNSFLLVDDDPGKSTTTKRTTPRDHNGSGTKNESKSSQNSHSKRTRHRNAAVGTDTRVEDELEETKDYKFKAYDSHKPFKMTMKDDQTEHFADIGEATCFTAGTDVEATSRGVGGGCHCLEGYFGVDCGIPEAAWFDTYRNKHPNTKLRQRKVPRRVINGVTVNHEFAMFEARLHELYEVVDVFIIAESNYTAHGDPKAFLFLERLRSGYMREFQDKILYVSLDTFPRISKTNGWIADSYLRLHLSNKGLPLLKDLRDDDLFVLSDADELPTREVITFLKVYDGYPEPIGLTYQWNVFGFFWKVPPKDTWSIWFKGAKEMVSEVNSVATIGMLTKVLYNNAFYIRKTGLWRYYKLRKKMKKYREEGHLVKEWVLGSAGHYAGWHCSWCFSPVNIVVKMNSAQADDKPRWGNMPEKKNLTYIASRIREGVWFDEEVHYIPARNTKARFYAPRYFMQHPERYRSLLYHPAHPLNHGQPWAPP
ncbi:uncharacterized protein LOC126998157 isoform X2 [Eriocheir sinensis]|uniref:uncharacterized protein LOC126998157 isoform X2 n=1 Tax=Eriocheir sinensis TaxID=95602 RepID=UPI0021C7F100|nr:uncharacterized protein LOC126998157 isoform X2 [Eriocheir sinensis]